MRIFFPIALIILLGACKSSISPEEKAVNTALQAYKSQPTDSSAQSVITAISNFIAVKGYADSTSAKYTLQAARISSERNQFQQALGFYKNYMVQYPDRPDQPNRLAEVITIVENLKKPELNQVLYKSFVSRFPQDSRAGSFDSKIENKNITTDSLLRYLGMNMFNDSTFRLNEEKARLYIDACEAAVMADPNLPNAAEHLHRAAETGRTLRDIPKAINLYDWIIEKYPTHSRGATSLFLKAFTYDNDLKDFEKAGNYYKDFLSKYPNNEFTESAKFLLDNLGKSEEELRKMLEAKSKENVQ